jgi:hypothetical protein
MSFPKTFLNGVKITVLRKTFDRFDLCALGLYGEHRARLHCLTIEHHGACSAQ